MEGYRKIIKCRVPWPAQLSASARFHRQAPHRGPDALARLPQVVSDVRSHAWFAGSLDFKALEQKQLPAPYVPKIKNMYDDSNFDTYTDEGKMNYPEEASRATCSPSSPPAVRRARAARAAGAAGAAAPLVGGGRRPPAQPSPPDLPRRPKGGAC